MTANEICDNGYLMKCQYIHMNQDTLYTFIEIAEGRYETGCVIITKISLLSQHHTVTIATGNTKKTSSTKYVGSKLIDFIVNLWIWITVLFFKYFKFF